MQIGEICWLLWANPLHGFRLLENHSRTENKSPGQRPCLNYTQGGFISCQEYAIECLMDSLFISELTRLNIYNIKAEHRSSMCFCSEGGDIFLCMNHFKNHRVTEQNSSTTGHHKSHTGKKLFFSNNFKQQSNKYQIFDHFKLLTILFNILSSMDRTSCSTHFLFWIAAHVFNLPNNT